MSVVVDRFTAMSDSRGRGVLPHLRRPGDHRGDPVGGRPGAAGPDRPRALPGRGSGGDPDRFAEFADAGRLGEITGVVRFELARSKKDVERHAARFESGKVTLVDGRRAGRDDRRRHRRLRAAGHGAVQRGAALPRRPPAHRRRRDAGARGRQRVHRARQQPGRGRPAHARPGGRGHRGGHDVGQAHALGDGGRLPADRAGGGVPPLPRVHRRREGRRPEAVGRLPDRGSHGRGGRPLRRTRRRRGLHHRDQPAGGPAPRRDDHRRGRRLPAARDRPAAPGQGRAHRRAQGQGRPRQGAGPERRDGAAPTAARASARRRTPACRAGWRPRAAGRWPGRG